MSGKALSRWAWATILLAGRIGAAEPADDASKKALAADLYVDMEAGSAGDTITAKLLESMTHGAGGKWSLTRGQDKAPQEPLAEFTVSAFEKLLPAPVVVDGVAYADKAGKRGWACEMATPLRMIVYSFSPPRPSVSLGFYMEYHSTKGFTPLDLAIIHAQSGDFVSMNTAEHPRNLGVRVHTGSHKTPDGKKGSGGGPVIPLEDRKLYWVSMRFVQQGESSLALFDPATFQQLGPTSSLVLTSNSPARMLTLGRCDNHGMVAPGKLHLDDLVVDWTKAVFPLLPRAGKP